jgi:3-hydroxyisobutyrate dehydrogenase-like beta-hydroxyacid dehydrogenase
MAAIGFVGFGEAGSRIAAGLRDAGVEELFAYDIHANTPGRGELIRSRAQAAKVTLVADNAELTARARVILSVVTANSALEAAGQNALYVSGAHFYADCNSVSPQTKERIAETIGRRFVEAAIMAPVPASDSHKVPMLMNGPLAPELAAILRGFGMNIQTLNLPVGAAAATKMCRSIVVKGIEAILFECVLAASRFGAADRVFASLEESDPGAHWKEKADYVVNRVVVHGERRAREMEEVVSMMRDAGIEPMMADATARRQDWAARMGLREHFGPEGPGTYAEVLAVLDKLTAAMP